MFTKQRIQGLISGLIIATLIFGSATMAFASEGKSVISIFYDDIKIVVDGTLIHPTDSNGKSVEPFTYNGTTYLPVRAVATALGKSVNWDSGTKTVFIGESSSYVPTDTSQQGDAKADKQYEYFSDILKPYQEDTSRFATNNQELLLGGKTYYKGLFIRNKDYNKETTVTYDLEGKYSNIKGLIGYYDKSSSKETITVEFYGDDSLIKSYTIERDALPQDLDLNVSGVSKFQIKSYSTNYWSAYVIANMAIN